VIAESNESDNDFSRVFQVVATINGGQGASVPSALQTVETIEIGEAPIQ
jgi:hypothetical protein